MNWAWHAFTIFRIPVHLHWTLIFVVAYWMFGPIQAGAGPEWIAFVAAGLVVQFAVILFHELGHSWASRRVGGHVDKILLWPLGGLAYVGHSDEPRTDIFVAVCGPATHLLLGGAAAAAVFALGIPWDWSYINPIGRPDPPYWPGYGYYFLLYFINMNASLMAFNLFVPAFPLDGGRILHDWLRMRMGEWQANRTAGTVSIVIGSALLLLAIWTASILLGVISVWMILQAAQLRAMAGADSAYSPHGYSDRGYRFEEPRKEGYFARRRRLKRERALARRDAEEAELRAKVDELLDKINREGKDSLTPSERKTLEEASSRLRRGS
ncbi:MAG TPA: site-2 protease family protein [Planctomycetota bacterium]|nr:site-2 protease family protein [Planctomycetota bacterium]